jgi:hypothetical protein
MRAHFEVFFRFFLLYSQLRIELNDSFCKGGDSGKRTFIPYKKFDIQRLGWNYKHPPLRAPVAIGGKTSEVVTDSRFFCFQTRHYLNVQIDKT